MSSLPAAYQEQLLAVVPKFSGAIGMPSNLLLMSEIVLAHTTSHSGNPILRSLAGVAFFLGLDAFGWFLSTWAVPEGDFAFSAGNLRTCEFQGFLLQVVIGAPLFCGSMAFYFWLIVCRRKSPEQLLRFERIIAPTIVLYAFGSAFFLLYKDMYNHVGAVCWVIGSPPGCENSSYHASEEPCERGNWSWLYGMVMFYIPLWICIVFIGMFNLNIVWELNKGGDREDARWFAVQSFLYALAFVVTWAPSTTWSGLHWKLDGGSFAVDLLAAFIEPMGGFWNLLIFLRNRPHSRSRIARLLCCECLEEKEADDEEIDDDGPPPQPASPLLQDISEVVANRPSTSTGAAADAIRSAAEGNDSYDNHLGEGIRRASLISATFQLEDQ